MRVDVAEPLLAAPVLVVARVRATIETAARYRVLSFGGDELGTVREIGVAAPRRLVRVLANGLAARRFELVNRDNDTILVLSKPASLVRTTLIACDARGIEAGRGRQSSLWRRRFTLRATTTATTIESAREAALGDDGGKGSDGSDTASVSVVEPALAVMAARNLQAHEFSIVGVDGTEIALIMKRRVGFLASSDEYELRVTGRAVGALRPLLLAAVLTVDLSLAQFGNG